MFYTKLMKTALRESMEYKFNFFTSMFFMLINNATFLLYWVYYFSNTTNTFGYNLKIIFLIYSVFTTSFGIVVTFFGNVFLLGENIVNGELDKYLIYPRNALSHYLFKKINPAGIGDIIFGLVSLVLLNVIFGFKLSYILTTLAVIPFVVLIITMFFITLGSLSFYLGNSAVFTGIFTTLFITLSTYPRFITNKILLGVLIIVVPIVLVNYMPVDIITNFSIKSYAIFAISVFLYSTLTLVFANYGMKLYNSSNSMFI